MSPCLQHIEWEFSFVTQLQAAQEVQVRQSLLAPLCRAHSEKDTHNLCTRRKRRQRHAAGQAQIRARQGASSCWSELRLNLVFISIREEVLLWDLPWDGKLPAGTIMGHSPPFHKLGIEENGEVPTSASSLLHKHLQTKLTEGSNI